MKLLHQIGLVCLVVVSMTTTCWAQIDRATKAVEQGNCSEAQRFLGQALTDPFLSSMKGMAYFAFAAAAHVHNQCFDEGIAACNNWINFESNPLQKSIAYDFRGDMWNKHGDYDKAIADYSKSLELNPSSADSLKSMAWLLTACPMAEYHDGKKAVEYAEKLIEVAGAENFDNFSILAVAYAEAGNFQEAVKAQEKALTLLIAAQEKFLAENAKESEKEEIKKRQVEARTGYQERLESYKAGKPWRMEPSKTEENQ